MAKPRDEPKASRPQPQLAAALLCERILEEKDGVTTLVRLTDVIIVTLPSDLPSELKDGKERLAMPVLAFMSFKSGEATGEYALQIDIVPPGGQPEKMAETTMTFLGGGSGVNVKANLMAPITSEGLYWYEVRVDGSLVTRMPLEIRHAPTTPPKGTGRKTKKKKG